MCEYVCLDIQIWVLPVQLHQFYHSKHLAFTCVDLLWHGFHMCGFIFVIWWRCMIIWSVSSYCLDVVVSMFWLILLLILCWKKQSPLAFFLTSLCYVGIFWSLLGSGDSKEYRCKLPCRVFVRWLEGILLSDYMQEHETVHVSYSCTPKP
jgi:hypothetical protein